MARVKQDRVGITLSPEMRVALEILAGKSGLAMATEAMVRLKQALQPTINTEACQLRVRQDAAFRSRDQWLRDVQNETYVSNAERAADGTSTDAPAR